MIKNKGKGNKAKGKVVSWNCKMEVEDEKEEGPQKKNSGKNSYSR